MTIGTAAVRIPGGNPAARRIEHRSAGGDVNPYLLMAGVLGAAIIGIEDAMTPPAPIDGNAYDIDDAPSLILDWPSAVDRFETSAIIKRIFDPELITNLVNTKRQEIRTFADIAPEQHWQSLVQTA